MARSISVLTTALLLCAGLYDSKARYLYLAFVSSSLYISTHISKQPYHQEDQENPRGYASIPYVKGVSERVRRVLNKENIKTTFKPVKTLGSIFKKPEHRPTVNQIKGIVYKVKCKTYTNKLGQIYSFNHRAFPY